MSSALKRLGQKPDVKMLSPAAKVLTTSELRK